MVKSSYRKSKYIIKGLIDTDSCKNKELLLITSRSLIEDYFQF